MRQNRHNPGPRLIKPVVPEPPPEIQAILDPRLRKPMAPELPPEIQAVLDFIVATDAGRPLDHDTIAVLRDAFLRVLAGEDGVFKLHEKGGQVRTGFTKDIIVACFVERERRRLEPAPKALLLAKKAAATAFDHLRQAEDRLHDIRLQWKKGQAIAKVLSDEDLDRVLAPHQVSLPDPKSQQAVDLSDAIAGPSKEEVAQALDIDVEGIFCDVERIEKLKAEHPEQMEGLKTEYPDAQGMSETSRHTGNTSGH